MAARSLYLRRSLLADSQGWEEWPQIHLLSRRRFVMLPHRKLDHSRAAAARSFKGFFRSTNLPRACRISRGSTQTRTPPIFFFFHFFSSLSAQEKNEGEKRKRAGEHDWGWLGMLTKSIMKRSQVIFAAQGSPW